MKTERAERADALDWDLVGRAARLLQKATSAVALTGAGISTPSGIPDFRSDAGLWERLNPGEVASLDAFRRDPMRFYGWFRPLLGKLLAAQPNPAHHALAALERAGRLRAVITQNIDGLHQRAGSREVYELHGHLRSATCLGCGQQAPADRVLAGAERGALLRCSCGDLFKPDIVLFDEPLPQGLYWLAQAALDRCDVLVVAGTSLEVAPVCDMPALALRRGARLIIVNKSATYLDARADVVLRADVSEALPALVGGALC